MIVFLKLTTTGIYNWGVLCTFAGAAFVNGEGGIDWTQAP